MSFEYFSRLSEQGSKYQQEAYIGMGNAQLAMNNIDQAETHYEKALERNSDYAPARVGLGKVALQKQNYQEAKDLFALVAEANTTDVGAEAQYLLGVVEQQQGNFKAAVKAYSNVSVLYEAYNEWVAKALLGRAESYIQMGQQAEARSTLNTLVEEYAGTPEAKEAQRLLNTD